MKGPIHEKSMAFAVRIVKLYKLLSGKQSEYVLSKQLLRSGTSIGANVFESEYAQSRAVHRVEGSGRIGILAGTSRTDGIFDGVARAEYTRRLQRADSNSVLDNQNNQRQKGVMRNVKPTPNS